MITIDRQMTRERNISTVEEAGGKFSDEYHRLKRRLAECDPGSISAATRYAEAVVSDTSPEDVAQWGALAIAQAGSNPVQEATVRNELQRALEPLLQAAINETAHDNYLLFRKRFDKAAVAFTKAHTIVSATTNPGLLIGAPDATRRAWQDGQTQSAELTALLEPLRAAAALAGVNVRNMLGLVVDADGLHRRRVWEAWNDPDRWTALLTLGATIATVDLEDYEHYPEPRPMEHKTVRSGIGWRQIEVDPEDPDTGDDTDEDLD